MRNPWGAFAARGTPIDDDTRNHMMDALQILASQDVPTGEMDKRIFVLLIAFKCAEVKLGVLGITPMGKQLIQHEAELARHLYEMDRAWAAEEAV